MLPTRTMHTTTSRVISTVTRLEQRRRVALTLIASRGTLATAESAHHHHHHPRRTIHSSSAAPAQLVQSHVSITPGATMQLPPAVPIPVDPSTPSTARSQADKARSLRGKKVIGTKEQQQQHSSSPVVAKSPTPVSRKLDSLYQSSAQKAGLDSQDLGAIVALDLFLLRTLGQLVFESGEVPHGSGGTAYVGLEELLEQSRDRVGKVLDMDLKYESTPSKDRRITISAEGTSTSAAEEDGWQSGIVTVAHVVGGKDPKVSVCSGFAIGDSKTIVTCAHTLESMTRHLSPSSPSISLVLTSSGHVFPITSLLSSLPTSDLLLLEIPSQPLRNPSYRLPPRPTDLFPKLKPLPVSPYPATTGTKIATLDYSSPLGGENKRQDFGWKLGEVIEYKDSMGRTSETGTYDELSSLRFSTLPSAGSSGGPIIDIESGAVVGVIRGSTSAYGDRQERGFGTPAEKVFECFQLPGFTTSAAREASRQQSASKRARNEAIRGKKVSE